MNKKYKKIIAKEFLIFIGTGVVFIFLYITWLQLHQFNKLKEKEIEIEISEIFNIEPYISLERFVDNYEDDAILEASTWESRISDFPELKKYEEQSLKDYIVTVNSKKYTNPLILNSKFPEFGFTDKGLPKDVNQVEYFNQIHQLKKTKESFFNKNITQEKVYFLFFILISITFISRYLIYGINWSIRQLRQ
ncbi:hypothetical protein Aeqsu_1760 [Aequorivita sublithincola DSM 14238]|uniref:Uncharacterized protein n=1 Tax=Aequorivita sublithincola (strain DSM 14238 / LMG 21431 / ACAM 643 / 9-3) TaxID=746697 RepID=I3YW71_AEQSU|nr:hypothetical protein [Aequorivita sublithincola]AFL81239.1 hypothetical protein Aeqsu_1760 [Aequorivita sublithincola DSM 14238]